MAGAKRARLSSLAVLRASSSRVLGRAGKGSHQRDHPRSQSRASGSHVSSTRDTGGWRLGRRAAGGPERTDRGSGHGWRSGRPRKIAIFLGRAPHRLCLQRPRATSQRAPPRSSLHLLPASSFRRQQAMSDPSQRKRERSASPARVLRTHAHPPPRAPALPFVANFAAGAIAGISEILTFYPLGAC